MVKRSPTSTTSKPSFHVSLILSGLGGQGKTLCAEARALASQASGRAVVILSADVQQRLAAKLGPCVHQIDIDALQAVQEDELVLLRVFSPALRMLPACAEQGADLVLDTAATWHRPALLWATEVELDTTVRELGGALSVFVVATAQADSLRVAVETAQAALRVLPGARVVLVANQRYGQVDPRSFDWATLAPPSEREALLCNVAHVLGGVEHASMPRLSDTLWQPLDRAAWSLQKAVEASPADLANLWKTQHADMDPITAAALQRRVAVWVRSLILAVGSDVGQV